MHSFFDYNYCDSDVHEVTPKVGPVSNVVLLPCLAGSTVARLQQDTSTTWFQTSNLIQSNRTALVENKNKNKETV